MSVSFEGFPHEIVHYILFSFSVLTPKDVLSLALTSKHLWNILLNSKDVMTLRYVSSLLPISKLLGNIEDPEYQHAFRIKLKRDGVSNAMTILWKIAECGCMSEFIEFVLKLPGINLNAVNWYGRTPFHTACDNGHIEIVSVLLACPEIDVNAVDRNGRTPLHIAKQYGNTEIVTILLAHPDDIN